MARRNVQVRLDVSATLTRLRQEHDPPLTQRQAAELVGVALRNWGNWERGHAMPALSSVLEIANAFDISPQDLLQPQPDEDTSGATRADILRLESKMDLLLDHFDILPAEPGMPPAPREITELEEPTPKTRRRRGRN